MAKAQIKLESSNGDSVVISDEGDYWLADEIILDTDPKGVYSVGFSQGTQQGAFEIGGRTTNVDIPIRTLTLPFWLNPESRKRFQKMWGTPPMLRTVKATWTTPSGPRFLMLRLSKDITYTTEGGYDADIEKVYHAVVVPIALNPMFEGVENASQWVNPNDQFTFTVDATTGTFRVGWDPAGTPTVAYTGDLAWNISNANLQTAIAALAGVGAGNVSVTGPAGTYNVVFNSALAGVMTTDAAKLKKGLANAFPGAAPVSYLPNTGYFQLWNPTDQYEWLEWTFDGGVQSWAWPDYSWGQELLFNRPPGADSARMIVSGPLTKMLSVMSHPLQDTYLNSDLSNAAGQFNGVEPRYGIPPYTASQSSPVTVPVICRGPKGAKAVLRQRRFWSEESGLE